MNTSELGVATHYFGSIKDTFSQSDTSAINGQHLFNMLSQIVHDIKGPLSALNTAFNNIERDSTTSMKVAIQASKRIHAIADSFLQVKSEESKDQSFGDLVEELVFEKRYQYRNVSTIRLHVDIDDRAFEVFPKDHAIEFVRALSNIIDNAVEALPKSKGQVWIKLFVTDTVIESRVVDSGKGIPKKLLDRVIQKGVSHQKPSGTGLGLYHADSVARLFSGKLRIRSVVNMGTTVSLIFPRTCAKANDESQPNYVLIDDDRLVRLSWSFSGKAKSKTVLCFKSYDEFLKQVHDVDTAVPIYIDANLGDGERGELVARKIKSLGFKSIFLTTGDPANKYDSLPWLDGVISKDPPWLQ